jgi:hypothetical protein
VFYFTGVVSRTKVAATRPTETNHARAAAPLGHPAQPSTDFGVGKRQRRRSMFFVALDGAAWRGQQRARRLPDPDHAKHIVIQQQLSSGWANVDIRVIPFIDVG